MTQFDDCSSGVLASLIASPQVPLAALAQAWLEAGASAFAISAGGKILRCWPAEAGWQTALPALIASIRVGSVVIGELHVSGSTTPAAQIRLDAEAEMMARLAGLETELENMTTELVDSQDQLLAMYGLTQSSRSRLNLDETLQLLAHEAARLVKTQGAAIYLLTPGGQKLEQYRAPSLDEAIFGWWFQQVQASRRKMLINADDAQTAVPAEVFNLLLEPLQIRGKIEGMLALFNKRNNFSSPDVKLARAIADHAGAQIENVLLHEEILARARLQTEMDLAKQVQLRLLPQHPPEVRGLDIFATCRPALQVGGDFYEFVNKPGQSLIFTLGDVTGKGMSSALVMAMTRLSICSKAKFLPGATPKAILAGANEDMYDDFTEVGMFATTFVGQYVPANHRLHYSNAGHAPVIFRPRCGEARLLEADGTALGVLPGSFCEDQALGFGPGDLLVVATDGFNEASDSAGEQYGYRRLLDLTDRVAECSAQEISDALFESVEQFASGQPQGDDQTLIVVKGVDQ